MSNFSAVLQDYQFGTLTLDEVETEIERALITELIPAEELIARLDEQHAIREFDAEQRRKIERCIWTIETKRRTEFEADSGELTDAGRQESPPPLANSAEAGEEATVLLKPDRPIGEKTVLGGRYRLEKLIGRGGMSEVYLAVDEFDEEFESRNPHLAVKVMTVATRNRRDAVLAMQREVEKSKRLTHENILRVHHFDRDGDTAFMTMELLEGESLLERLAKSTRGGLPHGEAEDIITQVANALQHAHEKGIVHADLKPGNVFIDQHGKVKVIDFGIARAFSTPADPSGAKTQFDPRRLGAMTAAYASPEMIEAAEPDPRDDIYSLGCLAYEVYTGKHPFARAQATDARDSGYEIARPKQIPKGKWEAIRHALAFDQNLRTPSAWSFVDEFSARSGSARRWVAAAGVAVLVAAAGVVLLTNLDDDAGEILTAPAPPTPEPPVERPGRIRDCPSCPAMVTVPSGSALIGAADKVAYPAEGPQFRVFIARPFGLGRTEVTRAEYQAFATATGRPAVGCRSYQSDWAIDPALSWRSPGYAQDESHPVACVSFQDAVAYAAWLSETTGQVYRLPSEAEWEYVAGTAGGLDDLNCALGNIADQSLLRAYPGMAVAACDDGAVETAPVAAGFGNDPATIADLRGNLFEWTADCWRPDYQGASRDGRAAAGGDCAERVLRGGSWFTAPEELRLTYRNRAPADYRSNTFGFRVVREINE